MSVPDAFRHHGRCIDHSTSGLCSTCEAAANAPPLPVECCSLLPWASRSRVCLVRPVTRQSYGHTAVGEPNAGGLLVHPGRTLGQQPPSPMVLIGSAKQSRRAARPERRRAQRRPTRAYANATRFVLVGGVARGVLLAHRRASIRRHHPRLLHSRFSARNTQAIHTKSLCPGCPVHSDCLQGKPCVPSCDRAANVAVVSKVIACRRVEPSPVRRQPGLSSGQ